MSSQVSGELPQRARRVWRIGRGWDVVTADGSKIGTVTEVHRHELVVAGGLLFPSERRIPVATIAGVERGCVHLSVDSGLVAGAGAAEPAGPALTGEPWSREPAQETAALPAERADGAAWVDADVLVRDGDVLELRREELVPVRAWHDAGEVRVRTEVAEVPGRLELESVHEEVDVEHVPVGEVVSERVAPWEEGDVLVVPVYAEEQMVSRRLVLAEELHIQRVRRSERRVFEEPLRRERAEVDNPAGARLLHQRRTVPPGSPGASDEPLGSRLRRLLGW